MLSENIGTILICLVLVAIVIWIIMGLRKDKKKGKSSWLQLCTLCNGGLLPQ